MSFQRAALVVLAAQVAVTVASTGGLRGSDAEEQPEPGSTPQTPPQTTCAEAWGECTQSKCCSVPGFSCFVKDAKYGQCRKSCNPGVHADDAPEYQTPWACTRLTPGGAPPAPPAPPTPLPPPTGGPTQPPAGPPAPQPAPQPPAGPPAPQPPAGPPPAKVPPMGPGPVQVCNAATGVRTWGDCTENHCCATQGFKCFQKNQWYAQCRNECVPGQHSDDPNNTDIWSCAVLAPTAPAPPPAPAPAAAPGPYRLDWKAQGAQFFQSFEFLPEDGNHGASAFSDSYEAAVRDGVVQATDSGAILRSGRRSVDGTQKRMTAKIASKKTWKQFLAVVQFSHVPYGCGVWPAIFTMGNGTLWPEGGELDILEYVNDQGAMSSFHTSKVCTLDPAQVNKFKPMPDANLKLNNGSNYNCQTKYCADCTSVGCAPNTLPLHTGEQWNKNPGVFALQRTERFAKVFFIPEKEVPSDLTSNTPNPDAWSRYLISYYPFADSPGCPSADDIMAPQQLVISLAFCGDWASKVWGQSATCTKTGPKYNDAATKSRSNVSAEGAPRQCRAVDPLAENAPDQDCCTQFISDAQGTYGTDKYLEDRAYFKLGYVKVFTTGGSEGK